MAEYIYGGPPGTGKTKQLQKQVEKEVAVHGQDKVLVMSFTKAAAKELVSRLGGTVPEDRVGTMHAICYRALGRPPLVYDTVGAFNDEHPNYAVTAGGRTLDEVVEGEVGLKGDVLLQRLEQLRARCVPQTRWPDSVIAFSRKWDQHKTTTGTVDFSDLIEQALYRLTAAPGRPAVIIMDEVQDSTAIELSLLRQWGAFSEKLIMAGDDDQAIYAFRGATPDAFLPEDMNSSNAVVLSQSYRVPRAVHAVAQKWVEQIQKRWVKEYLPRDADGSVRTLRSTYHEPTYLVEELAAHADSGRRVMVLASCGYMLSGLLRALRDAGVPFCNPFRAIRGDWNPITNSAATDRTFAFLRPQPSVHGEDARIWTWGEMAELAKVLRSDGVFQTGKKTALSREGYDPDVPMSMDDLVDVLVEQAISPMLAGNLDWFYGSMLVNKQSAFSLPVTTIKRRGVEALRKEPSIIVGTIHSVKGGEADSVYVFPDLSMAGALEHADRVRGGRDSVLRQFYVALTRAREEVVLLDPAGPRAVRWGGVL